MTPNNTNGPAALRRMLEMFLSGATDLDVLEFDSEKLASDWQAERAQAAADRAALERALALLDDIEWNGNDDADQCPSCLNLKKDGHMAICKLAAALGLGGAR